MKRQSLFFPELDAAYVLFMSGYTYKQLAIMFEVTEAYLQMAFSFNYAEVIDDKE